MTDVERLLSEYKEAHRGGAGDPRPFLSRASAEDRELLAGLIDAYLEEAPRRPCRPLWASPPPRRWPRGSSGRWPARAALWPALLPRLRARARPRRAELVASWPRGWGRRPAGEGRGYYHQMEQGLLPAPGVSDTVLEALGKIVGVAARASKGRALPAPGPPRMDEAAVFARTASRAPPGGEAGLRLRERAPRSGTRSTGSSAVAERQARLRPDSLAYAGTYRPIPLRHCDRGTAGSTEALGAGDAHRPPAAPARPSTTCSCCRAARRGGPRRRSGGERGCGESTRRRARARTIGRSWIRRSNSEPSACSRSARLDLGRRQAARAGRAHRRLVLRPARARRGGPARRPACRADSGAVAVRPAAALAWRDLGERRGGA